MTMAIALLIMKVIQLIARLKHMIETELATRQAIAELSEMSDHMLRDLGISRSEIQSVVRQPGIRVGTDEGLLAPGDERASIVPKAIPPEHARESARSLVMSR